MVNPTRVSSEVRIDDAVVDAVRLVWGTWVAADQGVRVERILFRFAQFCRRGYGVDMLRDVTPALAEAFVHSPEAGGGEPSLAKRHLRRTALRVLFRSARAAGVSVGDPTLDLVLPSKGPRQTRPLSDEEVSLCRACASWSLEDSRRAASWAVAEATCRTGELPYLTVGDVDVEGGRVWLHGGRRVTPRWGQLTPWGLNEVKRRLTGRGAEGDRPLVYKGRDPRDGGRASSSLALLDVIRRAGLSDDPGVRPSSIAAWAGRRVLEETGRIDVVAERLGLRSLDRTADFIGWDWRTRT